MSENVLHANNNLTIMDYSLPSPSNFSLYARRVQNIPMLSEKEETELAKRLIKYNDLDAAKKLILSHLRLVVKVVKEHSNYGANQADLVQEGNIGLMKAVKGFDPYKGVRLGVYALIWIESEIRSFILNNIRMVKIGSTNALKKLFFNYRKSINQWKKEFGIEDKLNYKEIAEKLNVKESDIHVAENYFSGKDISINIDKEEQENNNEVLLLEDVNYYKNTEELDNPEDIIMLERDHDLYIAHISNIISNLDERSKDILINRKMIDKPASLSTLAKKWNISIERVRQIEQEIILNIRKEIAI